MSKPVSIGQSHNVISILANNADWDALHGDVLQRIINNPRVAGANFTTFLKNGAQMVIGSRIPIDRSRPFDPAEFLGRGWTIAEEDEHSLALTEVDFFAVQLEHMIRPGETFIRGEERLTRLKKTGHIRLDAKVFQTLWKNKYLIPEIWPTKIGGKTCFIFFDGTIFCSPCGTRHALYLYRSDVGWMYSFIGIAPVLGDDALSAVLVS